MKEKVQRLLKNRRFLMCLLDMLVFTLFYGCFTLSQYLIHPENFQGMAQYGVHFAILFIALCLFRQLFRVYKQIWRYAFYNSYLKLIISDGCAGAVALLITWLSGYYVGVWQTMSLVAIPLLVSCAMRLLYQNWRLHTINGTQNHQEYIAIIGAGNAGNALAAVIRTEPSAMSVILWLTGVRPFRPRNMTGRLMQKASWPAAHVKTCSTASTATERPMWTAF